MSIKSNETLIVGSWDIVDGRMTADAELQRIYSLVNDELEYVGISKSGWERLYRDPRDGRYWEVYLPYGEMQGGGPESLRVVDLKTVQENYGLAAGGQVLQVTIPSSGTTP